MAALVAPAQRRTGLVRAIGSGGGGDGGGRKPDGARPVRIMSRHAPRRAASSGQRAVLRWNLSSALSTLRPYVMVGAPVGRRCGTQHESMRRGSRDANGMRLTWPSQRACRRATYMSIMSSPSCCPSACVEMWCCRRRRSSENASSGLGCSLGCCSRLLRHRDHVCRASLVQIRRARTVPPRERRMPAAARQLKHDRRLAARLAPASSTTSRARADGASAPRVCASLRTATLRSLRLPAPRGAGLYYGRRPEGPGSNHATITASLSRFPLTPL
jgi:hypothetical protein